MQKVDKTVIKETKYIAVCMIIFSVIMELLFVAFSKWNYSVLLANILSGSAMIINFFVMGLYVQKAVASDEKEAKKIIKTSQSLRTLFLFVVVVAGVTAPCFSTLATIIPLFFPRIAIALRPLWKDKKTEGKEAVQNEE